jgi:organic hydroperoxide reductase OsmC/OhrA
LTERRFEHSVSLDREGRLRADGSSPLEPEEAWTPEHLVLAALVRCTIASLRFYAEKMSVAVGASGGADGIVTKREDDGRYAFTQVECGLDVELEPLPEEADLEQLLDSAEWGCFVGGSLTAKPRYEWRVNGEVVSR